MQQPFQSHDAHIPFILQVTSYSVVSVSISFVQFFIDFHLYGMNFIHFETVRFRVEDSPTVASPARSTSKVASESCEPDACLLSASSSSSRSCDLAATPSQKYWSMQDIERYNNVCISVNYVYSNISCILKLVCIVLKYFYHCSTLSSEMISSLSKVSSCELECDGLAVHITNKAKQSTTS